jgi:hypothetical protein
MKKYFILFILILMNKGYTNLKKNARDYINE